MLLVTQLWFIFISLFWYFLWQIYIFGLNIYHIIICCWIHGFHHLIVFIFVNRDTQQLDISYRNIAFKQTWFCIWTCTDVLGRLYLYRLGRLYLYTRGRLYLYRLGRLYFYVWQIFERSPIAVMSHCSPINTRDAYARQRLQRGLFLTKESVGRIMVDASGFLTPCIHWKVPRGLCVSVDRVPRGNELDTDITEQQHGRADLDRKLEMSSFGDICSTCIPSPWDKGTDIYNPNWSCSFYLLYHIESLYTLSISNLL